MVRVVRCSSLLRSQCSRRLLAADWPTYLLPHCHSDDFDLCLKCYSTSVYLRRAHEGDHAFLWMPPGASAVLTRSDVRFPDLYARADGPQVSVFGVTSSPRPRAPPAPPKAKQRGNKRARDTGSAPAARTDTVENPLATSLSAASPSPAPAGADASPSTVPAEADAVAGEVAGNAIGCVAGTGADTGGLQSMVTRAVPSDFPRIAEIEELAFGDDAWSLRQLSQLCAPSSNKQVDVLWAQPCARCCFPSRFLCAWSNPSSSARFSSVVPFKRFPCVYLACSRLPLRYRSTTPSSFPTAPVVAGYIGSRLAREADGRLLCYISSMAVCPSFRGHGFGGALVAHVLASARRRCADAAVLHVRVSNAAAIAIYRAHGFSARRVQRGYYPTSEVGGAEDAWLMVADLQSWHA